MMLLNLLSTSHCHLCEQAEVIIRNLAHQECIHLTIIEISEDLTMMERYGRYIPVLQRLNTQTEICWPFNLQQLEEFIL